MARQNKKAIDWLAKMIEAKKASLAAQVARTLAVRGIRPEKEDLEDVISQAFLDAAGRLQRSPVDLENPEAWFRRVLFYASLHHLRGRVKDPQLSKSLDALEEEGALLDAISHLDIDRKILAQELLDRLDSEERLIFERAAQGFTSMEIARELDKQAPAIRKRMSRGLDRLRKYAKEKDR